MSSPSEEELVALMREGLDARADGEFERALARFRAAAPHMEKTAHRARVRPLIAQCLLRLGDDEACLREARAGLADYRREGAPDRVQELSFVLVIGHALEALERWREAVRVYETAVELTDAAERTNAVWRTRAFLARCQWNAGDREGSSRTMAEACALLTPEERESEKGRQLRAQRESQERALRTS